MIDLHTHVLPAIDDGANDLDETLAMLTIAVADGTATIVGTPHYAGYDGTDPTYPHRVAERLAMVRQRIRERNLPIEVHGGFELSLTPALAELGPAARALGIHASRYLLVELPFTIWPPFAHEVLFRLQSAGLRPILAHVERYAVVLRDEEVARDLVRRGTLLQVNSDSLLGRGGRRIQRCARHLLDRGLISFLASDAHSAGHRPPGLQPALQVAARRIGDAAAEALVAGNPAAVIADADLPPAPPPRRRRWILW